MDRTEFLNKFFKMYPTSFTEANIPVWWEIYEGILPVTIDYNRLFNDLIMNWHTMGTAPSPNWFKENHLITNAKKDERCAAIVHIEEIKRTAEPMPEDVKTKMRDLMNKLKMGV